jgi:hypothetical protein
MTLVLDRLSLNPACVVDLLGDLGHFLVLSESLKFQHTILTLSYLVRSRANEWRVLNVTVNGSWHCSNVPNGRVSQAYVQRQALGHH